MGDWISVGGIQADRYWADFCRVLNLPHLVEDTRFANMEVRGRNSAALVPMLDEVFARKSRSHWIEELTSIKMPCAPVNTYDDLADDPQVVANNYIEQVEHPSHGILRTVGTTIRFGETPGRVRTAAPEFGQHTEEVLLEAGFEWDEIVSLRRDGIL